MKSAAETRAIMKKLRAQHPNADTELHFRNAYELLVGAIPTRRAGPGPEHPRRPRRPPSLADLS